jgi:hypothetical protein
MRIHPACGGLCSHVEGVHESYRNAVFVVAAVRSALATAERLHRSQKLPLFVWTTMAKSST